MSVQKMKILAIADAYIPADVVEAGTTALVDAGHDLQIETWGPATPEELQEINLAVEQRGADAIVLPSKLQARVRQADVVITQFAPIGSALIESAQLAYIGVMRGGRRRARGAGGEHPGTQRPGSR